MRFFVLLKIFAIITVVMLASTLKVTSSEKNETVFVLTAEEKAYLEKLKSRTITIAYSYDLVNAAFDGKRTGILEPLINIMHNELGLDIEMTKAGWEEAFSKINSGEVDFYGPVALSETRRNNYLTVEPFYRSHSKIITRVSEPVHSMLGLYNRSIGLLTGSVMSRTMQAYLGPNGKTVYYPDMDKMIQGLRDGEIDAFATVDNAEFEILAHKDVQFEFSIDNLYVDQGLLSNNDELSMLIEILNRYIEYNPQISDEIVALRKETILRFTRERLKDEIDFLKKNYDSATIYADLVLYPLSYIENGVVKGMQVEINNVFKELTGMDISLVSYNDYPGGILEAMEGLKAGENMAVLGSYYDIDTWNDPDIEYSQLIWLETLRAYSYDVNGTLSGKIIGTTRFTTDYLGWNDTTGNSPVLYNSRNEMIKGLKEGEVEAVFLGEMRFNYGYTVLKEYALREILGISAEAPMHMLYGSQNQEFNALYNESIILFHVINPKALGQWKSLSDNYKSDFIRMRHYQQIWITVIIIVFIALIAALIYFIIRSQNAHRKTKTQLVKALDMAHVDALTGIYNRRLLDLALKRAVKAMSRSGEPLTLLMIDVDYFKLYNDTYGHNKGDDCLKAVAKAIKEGITKDGSIAARYGGEEFSIVLPNTDKKEGIIYAGKIIESIFACDIPHESSGVSDRVTVSIGITTGYPDPMLNADDYIRRADEALYLSKKKGRNRYTFFRLNGAD